MCLEADGFFPSEILRPNIYFSEITVLSIPAINVDGSVFILSGISTAQDVTFFYTVSHLSELQSYALIFSTNFYFIFTFK